MSNPKDLTRKSLENVYSMNFRRLECLRLKNGEIRGRLRDISEKSDNAEVNGSLKALVKFMDFNEMSQFTVTEKPKIITSYPNWYWFLGGAIVANAVYIACNWISWLYL